MASPAVISPSPDRHSRRRPFASWVRKLTNLKSTDQHNGKKASHGFMAKMSNNNNRVKNNPYPESGNQTVRPQAPDLEMGSMNGGGASPDTASRPVSSSVRSVPVSETNNGAVAHSTWSAAPTVATNPDTIGSDAGHSKAFTSKTGGAMSSVDGARGNSTFSSPNQSQQSLATTLTTIQSDSPATVLAQQGRGNSTHASSERGQGSVSFPNQFGVPGPASALPPHLAPVGHPSTYTTATANNLLTDDASILTLASSSKRRRRRSMDTDASVRALAPSSVWGGSRESLPLSILSNTIDTQGTGTLPSQGRPSMAGTAAERASIYSSHSVAAPALMSDRNSYYANSMKPSVKDKDRDRDNRSIDGRSTYRDADEKSVHGARSLHESIRGYEGSIRSGAIGHHKDSNPSALAHTLSGPNQPFARDLDSSSRRSSTLPNDAGDDGEVMERKVSKVDHA